MAIKKVMWLKWSMVYIGKTVKNTANTIETFVYSQYWRK